MKILFPVAAVIPFLLGAGCQRPFLEIWLILEVRDAETGLPVSDAVVSVPSLLLQVDLDLPAVTLPLSAMAPTDATGRTWVPAVLVERPFLPRDFVATVEFGGKQESLSLSTAAGSSTNGQLFSCTVVEVRRDAPPARPLEVVFGSSPTRIIIDAYLDHLNVNTTKCDHPVFAIGAGTARPQYLDEFVLDTVPQNFAGGTLEGRCVDLSPSKQARFWVSAFYDALQDKGVDSAVFCLDENGVTVVCR